jgi:ADP-ribose pyrophosphatase
MQTDPPEQRWTLISSKPVYQNSYVAAYCNAYETPSCTPVDDYFVVERSNFVLVLAHSSRGILLVRQYRPAWDRFYWAVPAGYLDRDESPEKAAVRELREETGYSAENEVLIGELDPLPGYVRSKAFVVSCDLTDKLERIADVEEISACRHVSWHKAILMVAKGDINEMQSVAAILLARALSGKL